MENINHDGYRSAHFKDDRLLRERRVILGLTQMQVAEKAKIPLQSYQRFESGDRNIQSASFRIVCRVIEALEMNISDFYHGEYVFGEKVFSSKDGLRYEKTGNLTTEDVVE